MKNDPATLAIDRAFFAQIARDGGDPELADEILRGDHDDQLRKFK